MKKRWSIDQEWEKRGIGHFSWFICAPACGPAHRKAGRFVAGMESMGTWIEHGALAFGSCWCFSSRGSTFKRKLGFARSDNLYSYRLFHHVRMFFFPRCLKQIQASLNTESRFSNLKQQFLDGFCIIFPGRVHSKHLIAPPPTHPERPAAEGRSHGVCSWKSCFGCIWHIRSSSCKRRV